MRLKPSIKQLLQSETGNDFIPAPDSDGLRWWWLDLFILPRGDLLELIQMPKGRFESYLRRNLLDLHKFGVGAGHHVRYKPLEALKLLAIDGLSQAGAWDRLLYHIFKHNGEFESAVFGYQIAEYPRNGRPEPILLNSPSWKFELDHQDDPPVWEASARNEAYVRGEWPPKDWYRLEFDVATFIETSIPKVISFLERRGVRIEDR